MPTLVRGRTPAGGTAPSHADAVGPLPKILAVDDEPAILAGLRRQLRGRYDLVTATDPVEALREFEQTRDFAVVVSDMRMPGMNGAQLLKAVRDRDPDVVRLLLTGHSEIEAAIAAINEGQIFRFLAKPTPPHVLMDALSDAVRQHRLITAERELLEQTLRGSVKALVDTLAMANPTVFSRAERVTRRLLDLAKKVEAPSLWEIELAGMLSHIGAVTLPAAISSRIHEGDELTMREQDIVDRLPEIAVSLIGDIPRLENVRQIIRLQRQRFDGVGHVQPNLSGTAIPIGARLLRVVMAYDRLEAGGVSARQIHDLLQKDVGSYDPALLAALAPASDLDDGEGGVLYVSAAQLRPGMVLADNIVTTDGKVLCARGQQLSARLIELLSAWPRHTSIVEPIAVRSRSDA